MRNMWLVIKHEIGTTLRKRSFWILSFVMPLILLGFQGYYLLQEYEVEASSSEESEGDAADQAESLAIGLVDNADIIRAIPEGIPPGMFRTFDSQDDARAALEGGEIEQYVVIPAAYVASGEVLVLDTDFHVLQESATGVAFGNANEWMLPYLINYNLIGDKALSSVVFNPTPGELARRHPLNPPQEGSEEDQALAEFTSSAIPYVYYFILIIVSGYIFQSVTSEKENRTVEVLLVSLQPKELMSGKLLSMTFVALLQLLIWATGALIIMNQGSRFFDFSSLEFTPAFLVIALLFLLLGYLLYASVMAATGSLANSAREAGQVTWLLILPLLPTLMFGRFFADDPSNPIGIFLSLFPFSSPSAMVTRMAVGNVPAWQVLLSLVLLASTVYLVLSMATRFFSPQNLLSDAQFSWRRFAVALRKR